MNLRQAIAAVALLGAAFLPAQLASAYEPAYGPYGYSWHGQYYHTAWGTPVALVVPPTAGLQTNWGWGVGNTRVSPIYPQYGRAWPGEYGVGGPFRPTPQWPSDTNQFGVYYVRGPW